MEGTNIMKRFLSLFIALILVLPYSIPATIAADGDFTIAVESRTARAGDSIEVPINITNNPGIAGIYRLRIEFDSDILEWDYPEETYDHSTRTTWPFSVGSIFVADALVAAPQFDTAGMSKSHLRVSFSYEDNVVKSGVVLTLNLKVKADVEPGNTRITISVEDIHDKSGTTITYNEPIDGTVTVLETPTAPEITTTSLTYNAGATVSGTLEATGGGITWTKVSGPTWLSVAADGTLSGTAPSAAETSTLKVTAANANGSATKDITVTVSALPSVELSFTGVTGDTVSKTYGAAAYTEAATVSVPSSYSGTITYSSSKPTVATVDEDSGEVTIVGAGSTIITANASGIQGEYAPATVSYTLNVAKKELTVTGAEATDREYDKTTAIEITYDSLDGVITDDDVTISTISGTVTSADAGINKLVTVTVTLGGDDSVNYTVTASTDITVNITQFVPTYNIHDTNIKLGSTLSAYQATASASGTGIGGETVTGTVTWYSDSGYSIAADESDVENLNIGNAKTLYWEFTPTNANYAVKQGSTTFTIVEGDPQPMTFASPSITKTYGDDKFTNAAAHTGGSDGKGTITYTSEDTAVATVDTLTGEVTIVSAGTTDITATAEAVAGVWAESNVSYTLTVNKKTPILGELSYKIPTAHVYSGNEQGIGDVTGSVGMGTITVKYNGNETLPINAGMYTVTVDIEAGNNYTPATGISLGAYTILKKDVAITGATIEAKIYDGALIIPTDSVTSITFDDSEIGDNYNVTSASFTDNANVGIGKPTTITVELINPAAINFNLTNATYTSATADIEKAHIDGVAQTLNVLINKAQTYNFDLAKLLPNVLKTEAVTYAITDVINSDGVLSTEPGGSVTSPLKLDVAAVANIGKEATITVTISSVNYEDFDADITVVTVDKTPVTITADMNGGEYKGTPHSYNNLVITNNITEQPVTGVTLNALYESTDDGEYEASSAPVNVGAYKLTLSVPDENMEYIGSAVFEFTITKKTVTVTAENKTATIGDAEPTYTYKATGLVSGENLTVIPSISCPTADMNVVGEYEIVVSGADAGTNYTVIHVNGTLTVNARANTSFFQRIIASIRAMFDNFIAFWRNLFGGSSNGTELYEVSLYKDNALVSTVVTAETSYDFTGEILKNGIGAYTFTVTALKNGVPISGSETIVSENAFTYTGESTTNTNTNTTLPTIDISEQCVIKVSAGKGGTISDKGVLVVPTGTKVRFVITADEGYEIKDVVLNGVSVGAVETYTYVADGSSPNNEIHATFEKIVD